jgi:hypothetical protein
MTAWEPTPGNARTARYAGLPVGGKRQVQPMT